MGLQIATVAFHFWEGDRFRLEAGFRAFHLVLKGATPRDAEFYGIGYFSGQVFFAISPICKAFRRKTPFLIWHTECSFALSGFWLLEKGWFPKEGSNDDHADGCAEKW